jgi:hypothetical protein
MNRTRPRTSSRKISFRLHVIALGIAVGLYSGIAFFSFSTSAQTIVVESSPTAIRIGERLTYSVSIGHLQNAGYAELYAVSRGRLADKDAIELRAKFKTLDLASATFFMIDESRTTFISPSTGLPLHTSIIQNASALPRETTQSFLTAPTPHADLLTMIYRIRQAGGTGSLTTQENDKVYSKDRCRRIRLLGSVGSKRVFY